MFKSIKLTIRRLINLSYVFAVFILGFLVFIHELGHFLSAKMFKMPVKAFSMGLGPKILKKKIGETEYRLSLLPIGGYVQIAGEDDKDLPYGFLNQDIWKRFVVLIAGVVFNFITAIVLFSILIAVFGSPTRGVQILGAIEHTEALKYVETGDHLVEVNGNKVTDENYEDVNHWILESEDKTTDITVLRGTERLSFSIPLSTIDGKEMLGISYTPKFIFSKAEEFQVNPIIAPFIEFKKGVELVLEGLEMIVTGQVTLDDIQGPVGIVKTTGEIAQSDLALLLYWAGLLSINLGVMNLLPIPALDGGQILFLAGEKVVGKKRWNYKIAFIVNGVFMMTILLLMLFITYRDVVKLFQ